LGTVKVAIHEADAPRFTGEKPLKEVRGLVGLLFKAMSLFIKFKPVTPDVLLKGGEQVDGLSVIHTPGHTQGSICLYSVLYQDIWHTMVLRCVLREKRDTELSLKQVSVGVCSCKHNLVAQFDSVPYDVV